MPLSLLLDIDGTLIDTLAAIVEAMNVAAAEFGIAPFDSDELRPMIGTPVQRQLDVLRRVTGPTADAFTERYYENFTRTVDRGVRIYPGVRETFPRFGRRAISTMSTRRQSEARHMLRVAGLEPYFRAIVGGDDVTRPKPQPDLPLFAARALGANPVGCVAIGDSPVDIEAGRAAGMRTIAVTYGYGEPNAIRGARPDATADRFSDLPELLEVLEASGDDR